MVEPAATTVWCLLLLCRSLPLNNRITCQSCNLSSGARLLVGLVKTYAAGLLIIIMNSIGKTYLLPVQPFGF